MSQTPKADAERRLLWALSEWRCEVADCERLLLYRGEEIVAEHRLRFREQATAYAEIWRAAIDDLTPAEVAAPDDGRASAVQLWTDAAGYIQDVTDEAARLLNLSPRGTLRRRIDAFFLTDRDRLRKLLDEASRGHVSSLTDVPFRPRERRQLRVSATLEPETEAGLIRWTFILRKPEDHTRAGAAD